MSKGRMERTQMRLESNQNLSHEGSESAGHRMRSSVDLRCLWLSKPDFHGAGGCDFEMYDLQITCKYN